MKSLVATVVALAILAAPAYAQSSARGSAGSPNPRVQMELDMKRMREQAEVEKQYNETLKRTGVAGPPPKSDPWSRVRPANSTDAKR